MNVQSKSLCAIGIGSNLGNSEQIVSDAIFELAKLGEVIAKSALYKTKPWGVTDQPDFVNAAALIQVTCTPQELLASLLEIERRTGRQRRLKWGPRTLDLDILTFGDLIVNEPNLTIPHKHMLERAFVLAPLAEIDPNYAQALNELPEEARSEVTRIKTPVI